MNAEWILILTLLTDRGQSSSIEQVPGFASRAQCEAAGKAWVNSVWPPEPGLYAPAKSVCVFRGEGKEPAVERP
jgi:hypothetical protein